jgi:hypothetical protein
MAGGVASGGAGRSPSCSGVVPAGHAAGLVCKVGRTPAAASENRTRDAGTADAVALEYAPDSTARLMRPRTRFGASVQFVRLEDLKRERSVAFAPGCLVFGVASVVALACSPFGAAGDGPDGGSPSDGASADGGVLADDGGPIEDAGRSCAPPSCVDFEDGGWPSTWKVVGDPKLLLVSPGRATSGTRALDVAFADSPAVFTVGAAQISKVTVAANVLVLAYGNGEVDLLGIAESAEYAAKGIFLAHPAANGASLVVEAPLGDVSPLGAAADFGRYVPVRLELDFRTDEYAYAVAGGAPVKKAFGKKFTAQSLTVLVGPSYTKGVTKPWRVRYDDVEITTEP